MRYYFVILSLFVLFSMNCKRENIQTQQIEEEIKRNTDNIEVPPLGFYYNNDFVAPDGKMLRIYNDKIEETPWGNVSSPIIYLYDKDNNELKYFNTLELVSEDFWPGSIQIKYNHDRHSFDMIFSLDGHGNYGTGYIDLSNNSYIRENSDDLRSEEEIEQLFKQGLPDDFVP